MMQSRHQRRQSQKMAAMASQMLQSLRNSVKLLWTTSLLIKCAKFLKPTARILLAQTTMLLFLNDSLDLLFFGPLEKCPVCNSTLEFTRRNYSCKGDYCEWSTCTFRTRDPPRKKEPLKLPDSIQNSAVLDDPSRRRRDLGSADKPFKGMVISLSGRLSRTHDYWRREIEKHGGKVANSVAGATCLIVSPAKRERGGSIKIAEALERGIPVVSEAWLVDSIEKQEPQPLDDYDIATDLVVEAKAILPDKDPTYLNIIGNGFCLEDHWSY